jgi:hypothetical protein
MPKDIIGALSGVTYRSPELDDQADIEVAFKEFADSLPPAPAAIKTVTVAADVPVPDLNTLYVFDGAGPNTLTLKPGVNDGDKIQVLQLQNGAVTIEPNSILFQGPNVTTGQFSALTLIWQEVPGRWVATPFFSSGISFPPASEGGDEIIDAGGFRYHIFRNSGAFYAHKDMAVSVLLVGAGGDGSPAGTLPGDGGYPGQVRTLPLQTVDVMQSYPVVVGKTPQAAGDLSSFGSEQARGGAAGVADTPTPVEAPTPLPADLAAALGFLDVGGTGPKDGGPAAPTAYGKGGSGEYLLVAAVQRPSHVVNHAGSPGSPGTPDQTICVGANPVYGTQQVQGDNQQPFCPATWSYAHTDCSGVWCRHSDGRFEKNGWLGGCPGGWWGCNCGACCTNTQVQTGWNCDGRPGSLNGSQCCYVQPGSPGSPGSPGWSETVWDPCPSGYTVGSDTTKCVDARLSGVGQGGDGLVVVWYATA